MKNLHVAVVGAGIVGLATALNLQNAGYRVTLLDRDEPGMGTSFGNAGLFADYGRLPFTKFSMLRKMPGMLADSHSPLSIQGRYAPSLLPYGWGFFKSCFKSKYDAGCAALTALQQHALAADEKLIEQTGAAELIRAEGCLALFTSARGVANARHGDMAERIERGGNLAFLSAAEVADLEPALAGFHAGGVFYPDTRYTISPIELSRCYAEQFVSQGGHIVQDDVKAIEPVNNGATLFFGDSRCTFDRVAICAGVLSTALLKPLGCDFPLVSERGYHLTLDMAEKTLSRPVGWLDNAVFMTPMSDGVRLAGMAEFAYPDTPVDKRKTEVMLQHATAMLGTEPKVTSTWVGSRPSTPDSLPVIGRLEKYPSVYVGFGHGHLGLTFAGITGQLITQLMQGETPSVDLSSFSPERFN